MRKLSSKYWNRFCTEQVDGKFIRNGLFFEDLVEELLYLEYPNQWKRTKKSHDYNRDFYFTDNEIKTWVECKNYQKSISLDVIAPTLVMAQIFMVKKIIFFSYSKINAPTRRKLYAYASRTNRNICIFDADVLDDLIIKHRKNLSPHFKPHYEDIVKCTTSSTFDIDFYFVQDPIVGDTMEEKDFQPINEVSRIYYNNIFEIIVLIDFHFVQENISIEIKSDNKEVNENYNIVDADSKNLCDFQCIKNIEPTTGYIERIYLKPLFYSSKNNLPALRINIYRDNQLIYTKRTENIKVKNVWNKQTVLIGENYRHIIALFENYTIKNEVLSCFLVYGNSGTGKTRLLKEMLDVLIKYRYKVVSFIGNESDSAQTLLKEIIYFIYEIPQNEILSLIEERFEEDSELLKNNNAYEAYILARRISNYLSDDDLIKLIDKYFITIYEKISNSRIAIVIDNLQYFGKPLIYFLEKYISYSKHQSRTNKSILLLSINEDYNTLETDNLKKYIIELKKDRKEFEAKQIKGFENSNHAILFLRELLNIKTENLDIYLKRISDRYLSTPYAIWQAVYSLIDDGIVQYDSNNKGYISDIIDFYDAVDNLPNSISELFEKRWNSLIKKSSYDERILVCIVSLLSCIGVLDKNVCIKFNLPIEAVKLLTQYAFLREKERQYFFDHDMVESFFIQHYGDNYYIILNHIDKYNIFKSLYEKRYSFVNNIFMIKYFNLSPTQLIDMVEYSYLNCPPFKLQMFFWKLLINKINDKYTEFESYGIWLRTIVKACGCMRNAVGFDKSLEYYEMINQTISYIGYSQFIELSEFRDYIDTYSGILHHLKRTKDAIDYLMEINKYIPVVGSGDAYYSLNSMLNNRLLINYREYDNYNKESSRCLKSSFLYAHKINNPDLKNELIYMNFSDWGYMYYALEKDKDILLKIWNNCCKYTPEVLPKKALNYYRKMIQLYLINGAVQNANNYIDLMYEQIEQRNLRDEQIIFELFGMFARCICLIIEEPLENHNLILGKLGELILHSKMKGRNKDYDIFNLRAITYYYAGNVDEMKKSFIESYKAINNANSTMHKNTKRELIAENIIIAYILTNNENEIKNIFREDDYGWLKNRISLCKSNDYTARGILRTKDNIFNLPILV